MDNMTTTTTNNTNTNTVQTVQTNTLTEDQQGQIIKMFWEHDAEKMDHWDAMDVCNEYEVRFRNPNLCFELDYTLMPRYEFGVDFGQNTPDSPLSDDLAYAISRLMFNGAGKDDKFMPDVLTDTKAILMLSDILEETMNQSAASKKDIDLAIKDILELEIEDILKQEITDESGNSRKYNLWELTEAEKFELTNELLDRRNNATTYTIMTLDD